MQRHRIYTNIGRDQKINVEIKQDFDLMEVLSLKFTQKDIYASGNCSEYGVVVGRISANNGYGVPNAKVSIFIPLDNLDQDDPVISALYPYKDISDKDENGFRYNLLPERKQHPGHSPTGTFMDQQDILTREECLEVFEKYYRYTVKTNSAGDFMIWGVPVGAQTLHIDIDLSDIGCFSLRPYDFIKKGYAISDFENNYSFKSSSDIDSLPQIVSFDKVVEVYPFWGNEELCEIAITRSDFDLSERNVRIEPFATILFSSVTDDNSDAVKRNGKIRVKSGYKCNLQTIGGTIRCVRFTGNYVLGSDGVTHYPELEYYTPSEQINDDGVSMISLPMNMEYLYTNEFGEQEITNNPNKGVPTTTIARFKFTLNFEGNKISTANYLVPNIREFTPNENGRPVSDEFENGIHYSESMLTTYQFSDNFEDYIRITPPDDVILSDTGYDETVKEYKRNLMIGSKTSGVPEDYFYKFVFNKVYTVSSFQGTHYETTRRDAFLGIKEIRPNGEDDCASSANYFPTNFGFKNRIKFNVLLSQVVLFIQFLFSVITVKFAEVIGRLFYETGQVFTAMRLFRRVGQRFKDFAFKTQERYTKILPLTIYPNCEECTTDDESTSLDDVNFENLYCRVAEVKLRMKPVLGSPYPILSGLRLYIESTEASNIKDRSNPLNLLAGSSFLGESDNIFAGDSAVSNEGLCVENTTTISYEGLDDLDDETITDETISARYAVTIHPFIGTGATSFPSFNIYLTSDPGGDYVDRTSFISSGSDMRLVFLSDDWLELTGQDYGDTLVTLSDGSQIPLLEYLDTYDVYAVARIYDRSSTIEPIITTGSTPTVETDCEKYDTLYDESIIRAYLWCSGSTQDNPYNSFVPTNTPIKYGTACYNTTQVYDPAYCESLTQPSTHPYLISTIIGGQNTWRLPRRIAWPDGVARSGIGVIYYSRKTKSGLSEFRDGVFTIIPVIGGKSYSLKAIQEWYRRKRVGLSFCGGVVNYSFIDNWLNGILYFFKFDKRIRWDNEDEWDINQRSSKFPNELVFYHIFNKEFYYRSCPFYEDHFVGQLIGSNNKEILHPTTFYDLGPRDEFINEICIDTRIDSTCTVVRDIGSSSYQDPANIVEHAINYRMDVSRSKFDLDDFFSGNRDNSKIKIFDGDITQLMSINCESGIEGFDLDSPHYSMYNGEYLDPENTNFGTFFRNGSYWGPVPIDLKFDDNGAYLRFCLNYRLGDNSQVVPFYIWNKGNEGFGQYGPGSDDQEWDRTSIAAMPLQKIYSITGASDYNIETFTGKTNYLMPDGEEEYLLKPMTIDHDTFSMTGSTEDMLERFKTISYSPPSDLNDTIGYIEGDLWLYVPSTSGTTKDPLGGWIYVVVNKTWVLQSDPYIDGYRETFIPQTVLNYADQRQVLSSPFLFYFGLVPGKTALDILMKNFGGLNAFETEETIICSVSDIETPTVTPTPIVSPSDISEIYFNSINVNEAILGVNNPNGRMFTITFQYQLTATVDNSWSYGTHNLQTTTRLDITTNNGLTWNEVDSVTATVFSKFYNPEGDSDTETTEVLTTTIYNILDVSQVKTRIVYDCENTEDIREGNGFVVIAYATANIGEVNVICNNKFQIGCDIEGELSCVSVPTPTPIVTETPTPAPVVFGFNPHDGSWSYDQVGTIASAAGMLETQNIETFALNFKPSWVSIQAWDGGHWRDMSVGQYFSTLSIDLIRFYPNSVNESSIRSGQISFRNSQGSIISYLNEPYSSIITVSQGSRPLGVSFTWVDNLSSCCDCRILYYNEKPLIYTDPQHDMSIGSDDFSLSFWTNCTEQYVAWNIVRTSPNPIVLAYGSGESTGIRVMPGHISVKNGTLSEEIKDGDVITISIGRGTAYIL